MKENKKDMLKKIHEKSDKIMTNTHLSLSLFSCLYSPQISSIKKVLEELKLRVVEVTDEGATLDGSDVLFTGE